MMLSHICTQGPNADQSEKGVKPRVSSKRGFQRISLSLRNNEKNCLPIMSLVIWHWSQALIWNTACFALKNSREREDNWQSTLKNV